MNAALGQGGVILGVAASLGGVVTLAVALRQRRLHLIAVGRSYALLALLGAVVAVAAMQRALITRDFTVQYVADTGSHKTPALPYERLEAIPHARLCIPCSGQSRTGLG